VLTVPSRTKTDTGRQPWPGILMPNDANPLPGAQKERRGTRGEWIAFIPGAHPGYISLDQYEANLATLAANAAAHGPDRAAGPAREGAALLQGIIICGRCGSRMTIRYHTRGGKELPTYVCQRDGIANGHAPCTLIPGHTLDERISGFLISQLTPLAAEAALTVSAELQHRAAEADALRAAHVERARYHADLARRRYLAVDPANRLVAGTLEAGWNTALRALDDARAAYDKARQQHPGQLTDQQKARIRQLVTDLPGIWNDPATPARERKRIARLLAAAALHGGTEPDLLDEVAWWQAGDFWQYALFAAVACIRAVASRAGVPVRQACQDLAQSPGRPAP